MHQNILDPAGKDITQVIQRSRRDVSVVLERVQCAAAEGVILDERIGRNALSPHGAPKRFVKYSLQGTTQGNGLTGGVLPVRFSM